MTMLKTNHAVKATLLAALSAFTLACGYSAKATPPSAGTVPTIAALSPSSASAGGPAFTLTVNGTNFGGKAVVNWNGAPQTTTIVSGNQVTAAIPAAAIAASGTVAVTVTNPGTPGTGMYGGGGTLAETSTPMDFTVN
ncbi:MAG TPA: IPT/TIG domain-containing protein [Stellaceae bacterium]|nr:IPT/TIG domain-containing protein [Candidatus Sulfotelmatobacter sp.]HVH82466.1 IPT/TIG domain-containing protein [Stellaceae bacterium]